MYTIVAFSRSCKIIFYHISLNFRLLKFNQWQLRMYLIIYVGCPKKVYDVVFCWILIWTLSNNIIEFSYPSYKRISMTYAQLRAIRTVRYHECPNYSNNFILIGVNSQHSSYRVYIRLLSLLLVIWQFSYVILD